MTIYTQKPLEIILCFFFQQIDIPTELSEGGLICRCDLKAGTIKAGTVRDDTCSGIEKWMLRESNMGVETVP